MKSRVTLTYVQEFEFDLDDLKKEFPELWADFEGDEDADPEEFVYDCMDSLAMLTVLPADQPPFRSVTTDWEADVQLSKEEKDGRS